MSDYDEDRQEYQQYWSRQDKSKLATRSKFSTPVMATDQFQVQDIVQIENELSRIKEDDDDQETIFYDKRTNSNYIVKNKHLKSASISLTGGLSSSISKRNAIRIKPEFIILKPFYPDEYLMRCSSAALFDDVINSALERLSCFVLGTNDEIRSVLYPISIKPLKSEAEAKAELQNVKVIKEAMDIAGTIVSNHLTEQEIKDFETFINYTDHVCQLGYFIRQDYKACHIFGRSASYIEYSDKPNPSLGLPAGTPSALKPMKPMYLGNIAMDPITWNIKAIQYKDPKVTFKEYIDIGIQQMESEDIQQKDSKYLDADNILYFVRNNNNLMKEGDDFYFGHSTLQCIMSQSEENRRINKIVIPQINQGHWAGTGVWTFPNWSESMMNRFFKSIKPGGQVGIGDDRIKFQETKLSYDYQGIINLKSDLKKQMLSVFGLPSFLMNFEDVTNRATSDTVVIGFNESMIQSERSWLTGILDKQWYPKLFRMLYNNDEFLHIKMKMNIEFENISFESFYDKAVAVVALIEKKIMTVTEGRNMLKLPPLLPEEASLLGIPIPANQALTQPPQPTNLVNQFMMEKAAVNQATQQQQNGQGTSSTLPLPTPSLTPRRPPSSRN